jgi:ubiquinone/menaquinone biosynthesis C-methylase UbiE
MNWRNSQLDSRQRYLAKYDAVEMDWYEQWIEALTDEDDEACLHDIQLAFPFESGMTVLDAGAGTGTMCKIWMRMVGLKLFALEPVPAMIAKLKSKPELAPVAVVAGFCDSLADQAAFGKGKFDAIVSRQLVNGLFDPLTAFTNWYHWLKPSGYVEVMDGLFDRSGWTGQWAEEVDVLPMSACRSMLSSSRSVDQ